MKFFIIALVILLLIGVVSILGTAASIAKIDELLRTLDSAVATGDTIPQNAYAVVTEFEKQWEDNMFLISMLLPHHHLDEVKEKLTSLKAYAVTEEFAEWQEANMILKEEVQHIRELIRVSSDNIL